MAGVFLQHLYKALNIAAEITLRMPSTVPLGCFAQACLLLTANGAHVLDRGSTGVKMIKQAWDNIPEFPETLDERRTDNGMCYYHNEKHTQPFWGLL